eukprot:1671460-Pyramimonas_sp.AAC.1
MPRRSVPLAWGGRARRAAAIPAGADPGRAARAPVGIRRVGRAHLAVHPERREIGNSSFIVVVLLLLLFVIVV